MVYLVTWGLSLVACGGIWGGLWLFRRRHPQVLVPVEQREALRSSLSRTLRSRRVRPDQSPFYMCMIWSLFFGGVIMAIGGPIHPSTIEAMDPVLQRVMSVVLCLGTGLCIYGFLSGTRRFKPDADLRECYRLAVIATPANVSTLAVYAVAVGNTYHWNLHLFGLGAGGILAVMLAHLMLAWDLHSEIKTLDSRVDAALQAALKRAHDDEIAD